MPVTVTKVLRPLGICGLLAACAGESAIPQSVCPGVAIVRGLERAEVDLAKGGAAASIELRLGPVEGSCQIDGNAVVLKYSVGFEAANLSDLSISNMSAEYFVAVMQNGIVLEKNEFSTRPLDLLPEQISAAVEFITQTIVLEGSELGSDFDVLIGLSVPKEVGLEQRSQQ